MSRPAPPASWADLPFFTHNWPELWTRLEGAPDWQPKPSALFRALELTPRPRVRVIIVGQDPYHTPKRATGLAFAFPPGVPPRHSLRNILDEVTRDTGQPPPPAHLEGWARQGVLLLNTALSVPLGRANGHKNLGWNLLVKQVLEASAHDGPRAFILWGAHAAQQVSGIPASPHLFVRSAHPSPLSAYRGFVGSRPFSTVNTWLKARAQTSIDWSA